MRYQITDGTLSLGGERVLSHIDFEIRGNEKLAVVGKNGAGKTTLLKLIAGELSLDRDDRRKGPGIWMARNTTIGMLHQNLLADRNHTVEEEMLSLCPTKDIYARERYDFEQEYDRIFTGFGFKKEEKNKRLSEFSGGEQTKIAMIKLLLSKPDILLLDEPTNHLDVETTAWMEEYLRHYENAVVMVSHDRYFLDRTAEAVYELSDGKLKRYAGNYTAYRRQREKDRQLQRKKYEAQQKEIERLETLIQKFKHKPSKASMARSKKKILERMQREEKPQKETAHIFTGKIEPAVPGSKRVVEAEKLQIGYDFPIREITLRIRRGQKIGVIGPNGSGKTTFLKTVAGKLTSLSGSLRIGEKIQMEYFDQLTAQLEEEKRVFQWFHDKFPAWNEKEVRTFLGNYLFGGEEVGKRVSDLSGGEKSRLVLACILAAAPNFLVLDEPTNHMDISAKETLESAFRAYTGTMLFVSHDRYFLKEVADCLLIFEKEGVNFYPFGYDHYVEHLRKKEEGLFSGMEAVEAENTMLVSELQKVPEKSRLQGSRFSTEQSYTDWQLSLALSQLNKAGEKWKKLEEEREELRFKEAAGEEVDVLSFRTAYENAQEEYTAKCLEWYEKWLDYEEAFESYRD